MNINKASNQITLPEISLVILCYKSGGQIFDFVKKTKNILEFNNIFNYELVLVGNYHANTDDKTPDIVKKIAAGDRGIIAVTLVKPESGMMGWDMKSGLKEATGEYIAVIDGDGQMPVDDVARVYKKIKDENLDLVKTFRIKRGDSYWRKILSWSYNIVFRILFPGLGLNDINSKPKIIKKEKYALLNLQDNGWCIDAEMMIRAGNLKLKIGEIPTTFLGLQGKRKSFVKFPAIFEFIKFLILYRLRELFKKNI